MPDRSTQTRKFVFMPDETIEQKYARARDYCQQNNFAEARALAYHLLENHSEEAGAHWGACVILAQAEETPEKCWHYLKSLLANDPEMAWAQQRFQQLKSELLKEAAPAVAVAPAETSIASSPTEEQAPAPAENAPASSLSWIFPFENEQEIADGFADEVHALLRRSEMLSPPPKTLQESLHYALAQKQNKWIAGQPANVFLAPAVLASAQLVALLLQAEQPHEAFVTANIFGEMCKVLLAGHQEKHRPSFEKILSGACRALQNVMDREGAASCAPQEKPELEELRDRLQNLCLSRALSRFFDKPSRKFVDELRERELNKRLRDETLAGYFVERLHKLIAAGKPHEAFVSRNLAMVKPLPLSEDVRRELDRLIGFSPAEETAKGVGQQPSSENDTREHLLVLSPAAEMTNVSAQQPPAENDKRERLIDSSLLTEETIEVAAPKQPEPQEPLAEEKTGTGWRKNISELYPIRKRMAQVDLQKVVDEFQQAGQVQEVATWLKARIAHQPDYFFNYAELAHIYEEHLKDIPEAFNVLRDCLLSQLANPQSEQWMNKTGWKLLHFCKRNNRTDLAQQLYHTVENSGLEIDLLQDLEAFAGAAAVENQSHPAEPESPAIPSAFSDAVSENAGRAPNEFEKVETSPSAEDTGLRDHQSKPNQRRRIKENRCDHSSSSWNGVTSTERVGVFIDHENLWKNAKIVNQVHRMQLPQALSDKVEWFGEILRRLLARAQNEFPRVAYRLTVGYWERPLEARFLPVYIRHKFIPLQPENVMARQPRKQHDHTSEIAIKNGVDFKLADEVRRAQQHALLSGSRLRHVIIVSGDGDFAHLAGNLLEEETHVQIWGVRQATNEVYARILGRKNVVAIDEECLFRNGA